MPIGQALEPFEGCRFHLVIEDRCDDVRPDAEVIRLPTSGADEEARAMTQAGGSPTVDEVLVEFLADQEKRLAPRTFRRYAEVVGLLRDCLNGYGHQSLDGVGHERWESALERDEEAFVHLFGPATIAENLGEFLDYFMIRKVTAGEELLRAAGTVTKRLATWLGERGYLDATTVETAVEQGTDAARDLPKAERLSRLLFEESRTTPVDTGALDDDDYW